MSINEYIETLEKVSKELAKEQASEINLDYVMNLLYNLRQHLIETGANHMRTSQGGDVMGWISDQAKLLKVIGDQIDLVYSRQRLAKFGING